MNNQLENAKQLLFGQDGLRAMNFKLFPGSVRELVPEQVSAEITASIERISEGKVNEVDVDTLL